MNTRGQSALEYLMTYGWALVVIVIVVAALVLLVGNPASTPTCSQPGTGFSISNQDLNAVANGGWRIKLSNITGRSLTAVSLTPAPAETPVSYDAASTSVTSLTPGAQFEIYTHSTLGYGSTTRHTTTFTVSYNDGDFPRNVTINCTGQGH